MVKKLSEEQKQAAFDNWRNSDEYMKIESFSTARTTIAPIEMGTRDITDNWDHFLKELFEVGSALKVPGRKAKCKFLTDTAKNLEDIFFDVESLPYFPICCVAYEQQYIRTMFFDKCEKKSIDGVNYEITNGTQVEIWNCKQLINDIYQVIDPGMMEISLNADSYTTWKKDLVKLLKEFDKMYVKHVKSGFVEMSAVHTAAMRPLLDMMSSNFNLHALEQLEKKNADVPAFRKDALQEKFTQHLTRLCEIFRDYGNLKDSFNIKQMLAILQTEKWRDEVPLAFYLNPLQQAIWEVRECLLKMYDDGPLHCKYIIEENTELMDKTIAMVQKDLVAQWLAGDELK